MDTTPTKPSEPASAPTTYVCLLSDYCVASFLGVLREHAEHPKGLKVLAVSSRKMEERGVNNRFTQRCNAYGISTPTIVGSDSGNEFPATNYGLCKEWFADHLGPKIRQWRGEGHRIKCNITGGTKASAIALHEAFDWDEQHYTPEDNPTSLHIIGQDGGCSMEKLPVISTEDTILLLQAKVQMRKPSIPEDALSDAVVRAIYEDYRHENGMLTQAEELLRALWLGQGEKSDRKILDRWQYDGDRGVEIFRLGPHAIPLIHALNAWQPDIFRCQDNHLLLSGGKGDPVIDFVIGFWWERLVYTWAKNCEQATEVVNNLSFKRTNKDLGNETDLIVRTAKGRTHLIECKVDLPPKRRPVEMVHILDEIGKYVGKNTRLAFALSPAFKRSCNDDALNAFITSCEARKIELIREKKELQKWIDS